jgi:hypothetical protein
MVDDVEIVFDALIDLLTPHVGISTASIPMA